MTAYKPAYGVFNSMMDALPTFTHNYPRRPQFSPPGYIGCVLRPLAFRTVVKRGIATIVVNAARRCGTGEVGVGFE